MAAIDRRQSPHFLVGLDGIRALAVIAVLAYHCGFGWAQGGFFGVEIFFVLSGFLITTLLTREYDRRGRIGLRAFWMRRARRLLPALFAVLVVTLAVWLVFLPGAVAQVRGDAAAAAGYVTNWWFIVQNQSYFQTLGRPSPFAHLWSLAIEEQFYLLWPLLLVGGLKVLSRRWVGVIALVGAAASLVLMAGLYRPAADPSLVYYGTDTRASGLLTGAALALFAAPVGARAPAIRPAAGSLVAWRAVRQLIGMVGLLVLLYACARWGQSATFVYRGGFGVVDVATAALIMAAIAEPVGLLGRLLEAPPLRWVGVRSYGIYLWHWPIFTLTRPGIDLPGGQWHAFPVRVVATLAVAEISYRYLEMPVRTGALGRRWRAFKVSGARPGTTALRREWVGGAALTLPAVALVVALVTAAPGAPPDYLASLHDIDGPVSATASQAQEAVPQGTANPPATASEHPGASSGVMPHPPSVPPPSSAPPSPSGPPPTASTPLSAPPTASPPSSDGECTTVSAVGDSVLLAALPALRRALPQLAYVDADVGLQVEDGISILRQRLADHQVGCVVIVALGTNGAFSASQFDEIMTMMSSARPVVFVNLNVPRSWEKSDNAVIAQGVGRYRNATEVDWLAASSGKPGLFYPDGIHPGPSGQQVYARLVAGAVNPHLDGGPR